MAALLILGGVYLTDRISTHRRNKRHQRALASSSSYHDEKLAAAQYDLNSSYPSANQTGLAAQQDQPRKKSLLEEKQASAISEKEVGRDRHPAYRGHDGTLDDSGSDTEVEPDDGKSLRSSLDEKDSIVDGMRDLHPSQRPRSVRGNSHGTIGKAL